MQRNETLRIAAIVIACAPAATRADTMLVCNFAGNSVTRYDLATRARLPDLDPAGNLHGPLCARVGPDGLLYVASEGDDRIVRFRTDSGAFVDTFIAGGVLDQPTGITWDTAGNLLVSTFDQSAVLRFRPGTGVFDSVLVAPGQGSLAGADNGTIIGPDGQLWVPSYANGRIIRYDAATGATLGPLLGSISRPRVLEFRPDGFLYVTSEGSNSVRRYNATTLAAAGTFVASGAGGLTVPIGMAFGPDGLLYVASSGNSRVLMYDASTGAFAGTFADAAAGVNLPAFITIVPSPGGAALAFVAAIVSLPRRRVR